MTRPRLLDLFCCAGGAAMGYHRAGFDVVVGVDIKPQRRYPFPFTQHDALDYLSGGIALGELVGPLFFDAIHASPPCQAFTRARKLQGNTHPDLIGPTRELLEATGLPYVIENVEGAPLVDPVTLCGSMFDLGTYRHRLFETNFPLTVPSHPGHELPTTKMGRPPRDGEMMHVVGHFSGAVQGGKAMGIDWMVKAELAEAVPPAYTEHIGKQLRAVLA